MRLDGLVRGNGDLLDPAGIGESRAEIRIREDAGDSPAASPARDRGTNLGQTDSTTLTMPRVHLESLTLETWSIRIQSMNLQ